jgi:hypothetical protein
MPVKGRPDVLRYSNFPLQGSWLARLEQNSATRSATSNSATDSFVSVVSVAKA